MALKLKRYNETPTGGFTYFQSETKAWFNSVGWRDLLNQVKAHRKANNIPIGLMFESEVEEQLCSRLPPEYISQMPDGYVPPVPLTWSNFVTGTKTLTAFVVSGRNHVDQEQAEERAKTCSSCFYNRKPEGCTNCNESKVRELAASIVGGSKTKYQSSLHACALCGCSLKAKVHIPLDILLKHGREGVAYPDWCWLKTESIP